MTRAYRKDGYVPRQRVHVRMDHRMVASLDELAASLSLSRAHLCDLILGVAVEEGRSCFADLVRRRVMRDYAKRRKLWDQS
jgi:hypothetical protein